MVGLSITSVGLFTIKSLLRLVAFGLLFWFFSKSARVVPINSADFRAGLGLIDFFKIYMSLSFFFYLRLFSLEPILLSRNSSGILRRGLTPSDGSSPVTSVGTPCSASRSFL